jgi:cell division protein FtsB
VFEQIGRDCFRTEPEARAAAIAKIRRSLASMDRQRRKLEERLEDLEQGGKGVLKKKSRKTQ